MRTDLLLFNASNFYTRPIYPYAFVQLTALGQHYGIKIFCVDLIHIPTFAWREYIAQLIVERQPRALGVHLRQLDSLNEVDYRDLPTTGLHCSFFPVESTTELIRCIRISTDKPIIIGGFGFSTEPHAIFKHVNVDYGIVGDPDGLFSHFSDVLIAHNLELIPGLVYRTSSGIRSNTPIFSLPSPFPEYTDALADDIISFYGSRRFLDSDPPSIPVEVMRGCPFRCYFCAEPHVKGRNIRFRNLDAIELDIRFLLRRGFRSFWLVCSEINLNGPYFARALASMFLRIRKETKNSSIIWSAYCLPTLSTKDISLLIDSGFIPQVNDALSLDDVNLREAHVPYRATQVISYFKSVSKVSTSRFSNNTCNNVIALMLGNAFSTPRTIAVTIEAIQSHGLNNLFSCSVITESTRLFTFMNLPYGIVNSARKYFISATPNASKLLYVDLTTPTFISPSALYDHFNGLKELHEFFIWISETFMSNTYKTKLNPEIFVNKLLLSFPISEVNKILKRMEILDHFLAMQQLDCSAPKFKVYNPSKLLSAIEAGFYRFKDRVNSVAWHLGLEIDEIGRPLKSDYKVFLHLASRYSSNDAIINDIRSFVSNSDQDEQLSIEEFFVRWLLFFSNVRLSKPIIDIFINWK